MPALPACAHPLSPPPSKGPNHNFMALLQPLAAPGVGKAGRGCCGKSGKVLPAGAKESSPPLAKFLWA